MKTLLSIASLTVAVGYSAYCIHASVTDALRPSRETSQVSGFVSIPAMPATLETPIMYAASAAGEDKVARKWKPITITVYGNGYQGQEMNGGGKFDHAKFTCAVPVQKPAIKGKRHKPIIPYGTTLQVKYGAKTVNVVVTDTCIGGTLDLTKAAMKELTGKTYNRVQGEYKEVKK